MSVLSEALADSPSCLLMFNETVGSTAADDSGSSHPGAYVNSPTLGASPLVEGTAVTLAAASSQEITVASPQVSTTCSIEAWFTMTSGTTLIRDNTSSGGWIVGFDNSGQFAVRVAGTTINSGRTTVTMQDGQKHHIILTKNGSTVKVYIDGLLTATSTGTAGNTSSTGSWHIGRNGTAAAYMNGTVDLFAIYTTELTAARVLAHFNSPVGALKPFGMVNKQDRTQLGQSTGTSIGVAVPGANAGDILLAVLALRSYANPTAPAGWTAVDTDPGSGQPVRTYYRVCDGTESGTYTWTGLVSNRARIEICRLVNVDTTTPFDSVARPADAASANHIDLSSVTPSIAGCLYVGIAMTTTTTTVNFTEPGSMTEWVDDGGGSQASVGIATEYLSGTSATGTRTFTGSVSGLTYSGEVLVARPLVPFTGDSTATSSASGTLTASGALTGSAPAVGTASGTLTGSGALSGSAAATASATGSFAGPSALVGTAAAASSASGTAKGAGALVGSADATASAAGTLTVTAALSGSALALSDGWGFLTAELPTRITATFTERWASGQMIGNAKPELRVEVREGRFNRRRGYWDDAGFPLDAVIGDSDPLRPWQAYWDPTEPYKEIPGARSVELSKTFDEKGIASATITIDNIAYLEQAGGQHAIRRGYLAPLRGFVAAGRTQLTDEGGDPVDENEWSGKLNRKRQITVHEAYGDQEVKTFTGLIDDVDTTSNPAVITITARSFGGVFADEEFFGWNIDKDLRDPVVFIDKDEADNIRKGGYDPQASSEDDDHPADLVNDGDSDTFWQSQSHDIWTVTEWVELSVGEGRYSDFWLGTKYDDLDVYISVKPTALADGSDPTLDGVDLTPGDWVDLSIGTVPGAFGGIPYIRLISGSNTTTQQRDFKDDTEPLWDPFPLGEFVMGSDSVIRVSMRNLWDIGGADYRAGVRSFYSRKRTLSTEAGANKWVRVGDISDVVKVVARWAGFKEWDIESTGAKLGKRILANRGMKYMDLIDTVKDGLGFEFFVADPTAADESIGRPVFRKSHVVADDPETSLPFAPIFTVTDGSDPDDGNPHLLTAVDVKESDELRAYIIRARGRTAKTGDTLGGDTTRRIMSIYRPPWSGLDSAGVIRHVVHTDQLYTTADDVKFAAWYIALQEALESVAVGIQIPAHPGIELDDIFELQDLGTGLTTRLQVRERRSTNTAGEDASWIMTLSGAITDTPELQDETTGILTIIRAATRDA